MNRASTSTGWRVQPSLLDRLTSAARPETQRGAAAAGRELVSTELYRDTVLRDLEWLFNTSSPLQSMGDGTWSERFPNAASSVLNFGLRGVFSQHVHDLGAVEREVADGLARFEPRLLVEHQTLKATQEGQLVEIHLQGLLLTQNAARQIWVRTDLETSQATLEMSRRG